MLKYIHDDGYNLLQKGDSKQSRAINRVCIPVHCNRSVLPTEMAAQVPDFDRHGNRLQFLALNQISWTPTNMLNQVTKQNIAEGLSITEYHVYAGKKRTRKITEIKDTEGKVIKIRISEYFGKIEKQTTYAASNQKLPQLVVNEQEVKTYSPSIIHHLHIKIGHRQIARQSTCNLEHSTVNLEFHLSNHIDSSQAILTSSGELKSYQCFYPYGSTSFQYGQLKDKNYQYSGEEKDDTGLHYYGARYYDSENLLSWLSPDPAGYPDGHLNRYTMVRGNPVTFRDEYGTMSKYNIIYILTYWRKWSGIGDERWNLKLSYQVLKFTAKNILVAVGEDHDRRILTYGILYDYVLKVEKPDILFVEPGMHLSSLITYCLLTECQIFNCKTMIGDSNYGGQKYTNEFNVPLRAVQQILSKTTRDKKRDPQKLTQYLRDSFYLYLKKQYDLIFSIDPKESHENYIRNIFRLSDLEDIIQEAKLKQEIVFLTNDLVNSNLLLIQIKPNFLIQDYTKTLFKFSNETEGRTGVAFVGKDHLSYDVKSRISATRREVKRIYSEGTKTHTLINKRVIAWGAIPAYFGPQRRLESLKVDDNILRIFKSNDREHRKNKRSQKH